jgi:hypothetical protein
MAPEDNQSILTVLLIRGYRLEPGDQEHIQVYTVSAAEPVRAAFVASAFG